MRLRRLVSSTSAQTPPSHCPSLATCSIAPQPDVIRLFRVGEPPQAINNFLQKKLRAQVAVWTDDFQQTILTKLFALRIRCLSDSVAIHYEGIASNKLFFDEVTFKGAE